jgi:DNA-binding HxlR family transcriptional regulator
MQVTGDFCSFEKAAEHLADRWIFLIVRELGLHGPRGFNALAAGLPCINRSVLSRRLRLLADMGLVVRSADRQHGGAPYRLTRAGEQFAPVLRALNAWAEDWVPEDPALAARDPDVIAFWLSRRADPDGLPDPAAVVVLQLGGPRSQPAWLVLERGAEPSLCLEDPLLPEGRYVHVEASGAALFPISRGDMTWRTAIASRRVRLFGEPALVQALPSWFRPTA